MFSKLSSRIRSFLAWCVSRLRSWWSAAFSSSTTSTTSIQGIGLPQGLADWTKYLGARLVAALVLSLAIVGAVTLLPHGFVTVIIPFTAYWAPVLALIGAGVLLYLHKETPGWI